jgi:hypothetical protein
MKEREMKSIQEFMATADFTQARNRAAMTMLSGANGGSHLGREVSPLGTKAVAVVQVDAECDVRFRTYATGQGRDCDEFITGGGGLNTTAYDLTGKLGRQFPEHNRDLAAAALRCMMQVSTERPLSRLEVQFAPIYMQFEAEAMRVPTSGRLLQELIHNWLHGDYYPHAWDSPVTGVITEWRQDQHRPEFGWADVTGVDGDQHSVLIATGAEFLYSVGDEVQERTPLAYIRPTSRISAETLELLAWDQTKQVMPGMSGEFLPLAAALPLLRAGATPALAVEDSRPLLGVLIPCDINVVRKFTAFDGEAATAEPAVTGRVLSAFRRHIGQMSKFASDADLITALDEPDDQVFLSGMAISQTWEVESANDMRFRPGYSRDGVAARPELAGRFIDLGATRRCWAGDLDKRQQPLTPAVEAEFLHTVTKVAVAAADVAAGEMAAQVIEAKTAMMPQQAAMCRLLGKYGNEDQVHEYLEREADALLEQV